MYTISTLSRLMIQIYNIYLYIFFDCFSGHWGSVFIVIVHFSQLALLFRLNTFCFKLYMYLLSCTCSYWAIPASSLHWLFRFYNIYLTLFFLKFCFFTELFFLFPFVPREFLSTLFNHFYNGCSNIFNRDIQLLKFILMWYLFTAFFI